MCQAQQATICLLTTIWPDGTLSAKRLTGVGTREVASTREVLAKYIEKEFITDGDQVDLDTVDLLEEEIIDSLGIFTLVSFIEDEFGISIDPTDINLDNFQNLNAVTALVETSR